MKRKSLAWLLAASVLMPTLLTTGCLAPETSSSSEDTGTGRETFRFAMISDIHLQTEDTTSTYNFARAVQQCERYAKEAGGNLDAVAIAGDLLDHSWYNKLVYEDGTSFVQTDETRGEALDVLRGAFDTYLGDDTALFYVLGNHDMVPSINVTSGTTSSRGKSPRFYKEYLEKSERDYYAYDVKAEETKGYKVDDYKKCHDQGCRYARIAGCNFIMLTNYTYWKTASQNYHAYQIDWLKATLDYIAETYADEPVFLITHNPILNTLPGSTGTWGGPDLLDILDDYPQVISFTGHIHESTYNEQGIYQGQGFTAVECGSVKYTSQGGFGDVRYSSESSSSSQGLLVTVEEDTSVKIERMDFTTGQKSGQDWVIPAVGNAERHTKYSLGNRTKSNEKPYFEDGGNVQATKQEGYLNVSWPAAKDDDQVWAYRVTAEYTNGTKQTVTVDTARSIPVQPDRYYVAFENAASIGTVSVVAEDCLGAQSNPINVTSRKFEEWQKTVLDSYLGTSLLEKGVTLGGCELNCSQQYNTYKEENKVSNLKTMYARGNYYLNAYGQEYEYSYNVSSARCSKAWMSAEGQDAPYRLGTCLASFVQNGRQISLCAQMEFNVKGQNGARNTTNRLRYYLQVTTPSGYTYSHQKELASVDLLNAEEIKAAIESEQGAMMRVERNGTSFSIWLGNTLLDTRDLGGNYFYNHMFFSFDADTVATFGVSAYGGEADYSNIQAHIKK